MTKRKGRKMSETQQPDEPQPVAETEPETPAESEQKLAEPVSDDQQAPADEGAEAPQEEPQTGRRPDFVEENPEPTDETEPDATRDD